MKLRIFTTNSTVIRIPIEARNYVSTLLMKTAYRDQVKIQGRNVKESSRVQNAIMPCLSFKMVKLLLMMAQPWISLGFSGTYFANSVLIL